MANILSKSFITGLFVKKQKPKARVDTREARSGQKNSGCCCIYDPLGASNKTISETFKELNLVRSEKLLRWLRAVFKQNSRLVRLTTSKLKCNESGLVHIT